MVIRWSNRIDLLMNSRVEANVANLVAAEADAILPGFFAYHVSLEAIVDPEEMGFCIRSTCDAMRSARVPVRRFVCVPIPPLAVSHESIQTLANVLGEKVRFVSDEFVTAHGAAIFAAIRAGQADHAHQSQLIHAMAPAHENEHRRVSDLSSPNADDLMRSIALAFLAAQV